VAVILTVGALYFLFRAALADPGIIPRNLEAENDGEKVSSSLSCYR
jgi:hypothetical protein